MQNLCSFLPSIGLFGQVFRRLQIYPWLPSLSLVSVSTERKPMSQPSDGEKGCPNHLQPKLERTVSCELSSASGLFFFFLSLWPFNPQVTPFGSR